MKKTLCILSAIAMTCFISHAQTVTDFDGNVYQTVNINGQIWMAENLKVTHYSNGDPVPHVNNAANWSNLTVTDKAFCYYDDDSAANAPVYGALYTWAAAMNGAAGTNTVPSNVQGICPSGWHVPSDAEWHNLVLSLDSFATLDVTESYVAGSMLKEFGTDHWISNIDATNSSGFTALPAGRRMETGSFTQLYYNAMWWSTTETGANVFDRTLYYGYARIDRGQPVKNVGYSVRCLCDSSATAVIDINKTGIWSMFPVPANDFVNIDYSGNGTAWFTLSNITGETLLQSVLSERITRLDISSFPSGVYLVSVTSGDQTSVGKLIKE